MQKKTAFWPAAGRNGGARTVSAVREPKGAFRPSAGRNGGARTTACPDHMQVGLPHAETLVSAGREPTVYYLWNFLIPRIIFQITV